jgi:hypothetical protein
VCLFVFHFYCFLYVTMLEKTCAKAIFPFSKRTIFFLSLIRVLIISLQYLFLRIKQGRLSILSVLAKKIPSLDIENLLHFLLIGNIYFYVALFALNKVLLNINNIIDKIFGIMIDSGHIPEYFLRCSSLGRQRHQLRNFVKN